MVKKGHVVVMDRPWAAVIGEPRRAFARRLGHGDWDLSVEILLLKSSSEVEVVVTMGLGK